MKNISSLFTPSDIDSITQAVQSAEGITSGEIVVCVIPKSDTYPEVPLQGAVFAALLALLILRSQEIFHRGWMAQPLLIILTAMVLGLLLTTFVGPLHRLLASKNRRHRVWQRAYQAFVDEEVFQTKERTGILIFISLLERQVCVLGDSGINQKITPKTWEGIVQKIIGGIKSGKPTQGIISAITQCGLLLKEHGFAKPSNDTNERPDVIRFLEG